MPVVAERFVSLTEASPRTFSNTSLSIPEQCLSGACGRPAESEDSELSVCPRAYLRNYMLDLHLIFLHVTCVRGSVLLWRCCDTLCTSGFMDDVMFAPNGQE